MRVLRWLWGIVLKVRAMFQWLWRLVWGLFGPPIEAVDRVVRRLLRFVKAAVEWCLQRWDKLWSSGKIDRGKEHYVGTNGVFLLATMTLFVVWYMVPIARWLEITPTRFMWMGFLLLAVFASGWRSLCREDREGRLAVWTQTVCRSTGVRRLDQFGLGLAGLMAWMGRGEPQLFPLAAGAIAGFVGLLVQDQVARPAADVFMIPDLTPLGPDDSEGEGFDVSLSWELDIQGVNRQHSATVRVSQLRLDKARAANVMRSEDVHDIVQWVVDQPSPEVERLAMQIREQVQSAGYSHYGAVACHAAACQAIPYSLDDESTGHEEYWRYPIETLGDQTGDCEDTSILLAALLRRAGFPCVLLALPEHIAVGVHLPENVPGAVCEVQGRRYYYCETTATGWRVGEMPARYLGVPVEVIPVPTMAAS